MKLLAFDGLLKLKSCCATPLNRVRLATLVEIEVWLEEHGYRAVPFDRKNHGHVEDDFVLEQDSAVTRQGEQA